MKPVQLYRLSGLALVIGMLLSAASSIVSGVAFPDSSNVAAAMDPLNISLSAVGVVGTMLALLGFPGMYMHAAREGGLMWLIGIALIAITAMIFGIALGVMSAVVLPSLASRVPDLLKEGPPPAFFPLFIVATLANVFGALLMAIPMFTRGIYARWCGWLMLAEAALAVVSFVAVGPGSNSLVSLIINVVSPLPLYLVVGWAGYTLWSTSHAPATEGITASMATVQPRPDRHLASGPQGEAT